MSEEVRRFIESIWKCPIIKKGDYTYFVHPYTDGALPIDPFEIDYLADELNYRFRLYEIEDNINLILVPEAMGIPIGQNVAGWLDKSYVVVRKRQYNLPGEIEIAQQTGYSTSKMYINSVKPGQSVIIVDDVVSTGGTLKAIIDALKANNVNVLGAYTLIEKNGAATKLRNDSYNVKALVNVITDQTGIINVIEND